MTLVVNNKLHFCPLLFLLILLLAACSDREKKQAESLAVDSLYNFGRISNLDTLKHTFYLKNTGTSDLKIDTVGVSCDCMTPKWQKSPIHPGDKGFINVAIVPNIEKKGKIKKYFIVKTNAINPLTTFQIFFNW